MLKKLFGSIFILSLALFVRVNAVHAAATYGASTIVVDNTSGPATGVAFDLQPAVTASSGNAYGMRLQQTLTAAANSDALTALYINPTFTDGAFTSVTHNGLIVASGNVGIGTTAPTHPLHVAYSSTGSSPVDAAFFASTINPSADTATAWYAKRSNLIFQGTHNLTAGITGTNSGYRSYVNHNARIQQRSATGDELKNMAFGV